MRIPLIAMRILSLLFLTASGLVLPGCGRSQDDGTIAYWRTLTGRAGEAQDELAARFNATNPSRPVRAQFQGGYSDLRAKLLTSLAAGEGPAVTQLGSFEILEFARAGALVDLTPFVEGVDGIDFGDWPGTLADAGRVEGGLYWLPFNVAIPILYYDAAAFAEAGLEGPPATWEAFFEAARLLTRVENGRTTRHGVALWDSTWPLVSAIWSEGGRLTNADYSEVTLDDPAAVRVLAAFHALVEEGAAILPEQAAGGHRAWFTSGRAAMILDSPAPYADIMRAAATGMEVRAALYPEGAAGRAFAPGGGGIAMLTTCPEDQRHDAWQFMRFLLEAEQLAYYAVESGYVPFTAAARGLAAEAAPESAALHAGIDFVRGDFSLNMSPAVRDAFDRAFRRVILQGDDAATALAAANEAARAGLARDGL